MAAQGEFSFYFDLGKDLPTLSSIQDFKKWQADNKSVLVERIYSYADSTGNIQNNLDLSVRRAKVVEQLLKDNGISFMDETDVKGLGEITSGTKDRNRKVTIYYTTGRIITQAVKDVKKPTTTKASEAITFTPRTILTTEIITSKKGDKLLLKNLNFYGGTATVTTESKPLLEELAQILKDNLSLKIDIQGHICCQRREDAELTSLRRAKAVYYYLIKKGISKTRLSAQGMAGKHPIYSIPEKNEDEQRANRRVEIEIIEN